MTQIRVEIDGLNDVLAQLAKFGDDADQIVQEVLFDVATETQTFGIAGMKAGGTGIVYQKYSPRRTHRASAPGQYPASDTGRLQSSIRTETESPNAYVVGTNVEYGPMLEFGTSRMAARPWLLPSFERATQNVVRELVARLEAKK